MDKETPLARTEKERQPMLLASGRIGGDVQASSCGDSGQEASASTNRHSGSKVEDSPKKGKGTSADSHGSRKRARRAERERVNQTRRNPGGVEGEDSAPGRSSNGLVDWHDSYCPDKSEPPHAHYWIEIAGVDLGSIFMCKYCYNFQWWPRSMDEAQRFYEYIQKYGNSEGYLRILERHPAALAVLIKLESMRHIRRLISDEQQLAGIVLALNKD